MKKVSKTKKDGGIGPFSPSTCLQDYHKFQYGVTKADTDNGKIPVITENNTYYKFFIIELWYAGLPDGSKTEGSPVTKDNSNIKTLLINLYTIQDCIHDFLFVGLETMGPKADHYECIGPFADFFKRWIDKKKVELNEKLTPKNVKNTILDNEHFYVITKEGTLLSEGIKGLYAKTFTFNGFLERFSQSLDNFIKVHITDKGINEIKKAISKITTVEQLNQDPYNKIAWLLPEDHIKAFLGKLKNEKKA